MSSVNPQQDYVAVTYRREKYTKYPGQLAGYLVTRYNLTKGKKILDLGCGRGEYLEGFVRMGLNGYGVDQSAIGTGVCSEAEIIQSDLESEPLPYKDDSFDVVFSKSVLEHFYYPEKIVQEIHRVLKPGGLALTMVPDWESVYKIFYLDYTHRTPFSLNSLGDIFIIHGFSDVKVEKFRQLPVLWTRPYLKVVCILVALISPRALRLRSKLVRFSQEIMLLSTAVKPDSAMRGKNELMF